MLIILLFLLVFGILGVQIFKGSIATCNDDHPSIKTKSDCVGYFWRDLYDVHGEKIGMELIEREWILPFNNYNHVFISMVTFFEVSTLEMWPGVMYNAIDANGKDMVP
jgi:voltage-dependent calcium channel L type alpha-1F